MVESNKTDAGLGDEIQVITFLGRDGNVVGRLPDGRIILFGKNNPYVNVLRENQLVNCHVVFVNDKYVIVEPISAPSPIQDSEQFVTDDSRKELPLEDLHEDPSLIEKLETVSEQGYGDTAIIARALLQVIRLQHHLIRRLENHTRTH